MDPSFFEGAPLFSVVSRDLRRIRIRSLALTRAQLHNFFWPNLDSEVVSPILGGSGVCSEAHVCWGGRGGGRGGAQRSPYYAPSKALFGAYWPFPPSPPSPAPMKPFWRNLVASFLPNLEGSWATALWMDEMHLAPPVKLWKDESRINYKCQQAIASRGFKVV